MKPENTHNHQRVSEQKIQIIILILKRGPCLDLEGKGRRQRNGDGIQTVANSGALGKSQKTNAQSGLVGLGDKHIVAR